MSSSPSPLHTVPSVVTTTTPALATLATPLSHPAYAAGTPTHAHIVATSVDGLRDLYFFMVRTYIAEMDVSGVSYMSIYYEHARANYKLACANYRRAYDQLDFSHFLIFYSDDDLEDLKNRVEVARRSVEVATNRLNFVINIRDSRDAVPNSIEIDVNIARDGLTASYVDLDVTLHDYNAALLSNSSIDELYNALDYAANARQDAFNAYNEAKLLAVCGPLFP